MFRLQIVIVQKQNLLQVKVVILRNVVIRSIILNVNVGEQLWNYPLLLGNVVFLAVLVLVVGQQQVI